MQSFRCSDWRDLGRSTRARFHSDKTASNAFRGVKRALLAHAPRGVPQSQRGARTVARGVFACGARSARSTIPRIASLGARPLPFASLQAGAVGGDV